MKGLRLPKKLYEAKPYFYNALGVSIGFNFCAEKPWNIILSIILTILSLFQFKMRLEYRSKNKEEGEDSI